jgi:hypothetical protein
LGVPSVSMNMEAGLPVVVGRDTGPIRSALGYVG